MYHRESVSVSAHTEAGKRSCWGSFLELYEGVLRMVKLTQDWSYSRPVVNDPTWSNIRTLAKDWSFREIVVSWCSAHADVLFFKNKRPGKKGGKIILTGCHGLLNVQNFTSSLKLQCFQFSPTNFATTEKRQSLLAKLYVSNIFKINVFFLLGNEPNMAGKCKTMPFDRHLTISVRLKCVAKREA